MMKRIITMAAIAAICFGSVPLHGQDARELDLRACLRMGVANNLKLSSAGLDRLLAGERALTAETMYDTRLSFDARHTDSTMSEAGSFFDGETEITDGKVALHKAFSTGTRVSLSAGLNRFDLVSTNLPFAIPPYSSAVTLSLSQSILKNSFGDVDRARLKAARNGEEIADALFERERQLLRWEITHAYWSLRTAMLNGVAIHGSVERAETLLELNKSRFADNLIEETDLLAVESRLEVRKIEKKIIDNRAADAREYLLNAIRVPAVERAKVRFAFATDPGGSGILAPVNKKKVISGALRKRPDLLAVKKLVKQANLDLDIKVSDAKPDLQLVASVSKGDNGLEMDDSLDLEETAWAVGLQMSMPIGRRAEKSAVRQAEYGVAKAANHVEALKDAISLECSASIRRVEAAAEEMVATRKIQELQGRKYRLERKKHELGRSDGRWVVQYEDDFLLATVAHNVAKGSYRKALASLQLARGETGGVR